MQSDLGGCLPFIPTCYIILWLYALKAKSTWWWLFIYLEVSFCSKFCYQYIWPSCIIQPDADNKGTKEKKKSVGKLKHGETNSFIPLFREPSSIEKIFGDFEREQQLLGLRPATPPERPKTPPYVPPRAPSPRPPSPRAPSPRPPSPRPPSPRAASPRASSPRVTSPKATSFRISHHHKEVGYRPEPTLRQQNASATKIQAVYRGYMVSFHVFWMP